MHTVNHYTSICAIISVAGESNQVNFLKIQGSVFSSKGYETFK